MFWDMSQNIGISQAKIQAASATAKASGNAAELAYLQGTIDRLVLINRAIWDIVSEQHGLTEKDLDARVEELDLRDGRKDGKLVKNVTECPDCNRTMSRRHGRCLYCGHEGEKDPFGGI